MEKDQEKLENGANTEKEIEKNEEKVEEKNIQEVEEKKKEDTETENKWKPIEKKDDKAKHEKESVFSAKKIIFFVVLILSLLFVSTIFAILNINNSKIIKGVFIENLDVSNFTNEEAKNKTSEKIAAIKDIELSFGTDNTILELEEIGVEISTKEAVNKAINLGRTNNILIDNYSILKANIFKTKFELEITINEEKLENAVKNIQAEIPEGIKEYSYKIKEAELIITSGKAGKKIDKEELRKEIISNIKSQFNGGENVIILPTKYQNPQAINIEKIYSEIQKEAKDAYIVEEPFELHKEEMGVDFAITMQEAKEIVKEPKETYIIPLKITKPEIEIEDLGDKLFKQTLAKYTTIYDAGNKNRSHNIALAAKTINGTILLPGETFSYNRILGNPSKENGYKLGTAYVGGKVVDSYGGGICQVSSTLYNSVLYANLEIVQRYNHSYVVSYVPAGRDATVSYGGKDFQFKNSRNFPIKIVASAKNGVVSVSVMGIKEEKEYEVVLTSKVLSTTTRSVIYEKNSSLEEGTQKVIQNGYDGKKSVAYKILKYNGKTVSTTELSRDTYKPMSKIIQVGTKKVSKPTNITPETNNSQTTDQTVNNNTNT